MGRYFGIEVYDLDQYIEDRNNVVDNKLGAVTCQFHEFDELIDAGKFAELFLERTPSWFMNRLEGSLLGGNHPHFTEEECKLISDGYRLIAKQLEQYADEIDNAIYK